MHAPFGAEVEWNVRSATAIPRSGPPAHRHCCSPVHQLGAAVSPILGSAAAAGCQSMHCSMRKHECSSEMVAENASRSTHLLIRLSSVQISQSASKMLRSCSARQPPCAGRNRRLESCYDFEGVHLSKSNRASFCLVDGVWQAIHQFFLTSGSTRVGLVPSWTRCL